MSKIKVIKLVMGEIENNTYIVFNSGSNKCLVIDPSSDYGYIKNTLNKHKLNKVDVLLTHGHFDHTTSARRLQEEFSATIYIHKYDADKIKSKIKSYAFGLIPDYETLEADKLLLGGEELVLADIPIKVIHLKGHSSGGVGYIIEDMIFIGDTIFKGTYGRYDFYDGNFKELYNSRVNIVFKLKGDYKLLCGHGEDTTLEYERANNEILKDYQE